MDNASSSQKDTDLNINSEGTFKALITNSLDLITVLNLVGKVKFQSSSIKTLMGYEPEELIGTNIFRLIHPKDLPQVMGKFKKAIENRGIPQRVEFRFKHKDGSWRYLESLGSLPEKSLGVDGVVVNSRDITERRKTEEEIKMDAAIFKNLAEGIYLIGLDDLIIKWTNPVFDKMFGYGEGELIGKQVDRVNAPTEKTPAETRVSIVDVLKDTGKWHGEVNNIKKDGTRFWCYANASLFDHPEFGKVIVSVHTDITQRKKIELAQKESEEKYRALIDSAPLCIKLFDKEGSLVSLNQHGREEHFMQGKTDEEIKNWKYIECIEEKYRDLVTTKLKEAIEGKSSEFDMEHVPGTTTGGHWCHSSLVPVKDAKGEIQYVLFISRDVTQEKNVAEEKNKNLSELERMNQLMLGRELKMVELKERIADLEAKLKEEK